MRKIAFSLFLFAGLSTAAAQEVTDGSPTGKGTVYAEDCSIEWGPDIRIRMRLNLDRMTVKPFQSAEIIPWLQGVSDTLELPRILVNGRVHDLAYRREDGRKDREYQQVILRQNATEQYVDYDVSVPSRQWMDGATLAVVTDFCDCGWRPLAASRVDITTVEAPTFIPDLAFIVPEKEAIKQREKSGQAYLDFPVNQTVIYPDYINNAKELDKIKETIDSVNDDPYASISKVSIKGYASPEGSYANNRRLAKGRAEALLAHVKSLYHFEEVEFNVDSEPEDWEGLEKRVATCGLDNRDQLLEIIRDPSITDPDAREAKLKQVDGGKSYRFLLTAFYPLLRHSDYTVTYVIRNFTVDEAKKLIYTDPRQLSLCEMYTVAQTYEPGSTAFNEVFEIAVRMYPNDPVSNLNAANTAILRQDPAAARNYLKKAKPGPEKDKAIKAVEQLELFLNKTK